MDLTIANDLARCRATLDELRLVRLQGRHPTAPEEVPGCSGSERDERLADCFREHEVARAFAAAQAATPDPQGEAARFAFRCVATSFLDRASADADQELGRRREAARPRVDGFETALACEADPLERLRLLRLWEHGEVALAGLREERAQIREEAARRVGASSARVFLSACRLTGEDRLLREFEATAIEPFDDLVEAAARRRRELSSWSLNDPPHPADEAMLATVADDSSSLPRNALMPLLRKFARWMGADPDTDALDFDLRSCGPRCRTFLPVSGTPSVVIGGVGGPIVLASGLGCLGRAARAGFLARIAGPAVARWSDPAFSWAVDVAFRRLIRNRRFLVDAGLEWSPPVQAAVRHEEALAPRVAWTYLWLYRGTREAVRSEMDEGALRASGRPAPPEWRWSLEERDLDGASELRGTILGLLLEERVKTRFGHDWYRTRPCRQFLREMWEAEPQETAESMASALGLGTIEPTPVLDCCRP